MLLNGGRLDYENQLLVFFLFSRPMYSNRSWVVRAKDYYNKAVPFLPEKMGLFDPFYIYIFQVQIIVAMLHSN